MKKLIVFVAQECCAGISEVSILNSLFCVQSMAEDANAVARAAKEFGYETFIYALHHYVNKDNPRYIGNYLQDCELVTDNNLSEILASCDKAVLLGIPAMQGTQGSFIDRNYGNVWFDYKINGQRYGQMGLLKHLLDAYSIPVIAVMSDTAGVQEAKGLFDGVLTVTSVYDAFISPGGWQCCSCYPVKEVRENISKAIKSALDCEWKIPAKPIMPINVEIEYMRTDYCDIACILNDKLTRLDGRRVAWRIDELTSLEDLITRGEE